MHELVYSPGMLASMEKKNFAPHMVGSNKCVVINVPSIQGKATHAYNNVAAGVAGKEHVHAGEEKRRQRK
jgi:NADP-dependent 3-hydroxy acid dehydrogenase YdfG